MTPPDHPPARSRTVSIVGLAAAYFLTGKLALLLAIPPGYATALWPPSGIALAGLLLLGTRAWPGILLGSLLVNLSTSFEGGSTAAVAKTIGLAGAIAAGASIQALLGAALIRRFVGPSLELVRGRDVAKFLLLGGPVSCLVNATVGVGSLALFGAIQVRQMPFSWWTWWVGDVIGVLVGSPLVLIALAAPREVWRRRIGSVALPLGIMLVLVTALFIVVSAWERGRIAGVFESRSEALAAAIRERLEGSVDVLRSLESFHAATSDFNRRTFRAVVERPLSRDPSIQALSWNPRVPDADRAAFEQGGADGSDGACQIRERDARDLLVMAPRRDVYIPIRYIEPFEANSGAVGYDVSSTISRYEALKRASDSGMPAVTRKVRLVQEKEASSGLLLFLPVYRNSKDGDGPEERRRNLSGYFACALRLDAFFKTFEKASTEEGIEIFLQESAAAPGAEPLWHFVPDGEDRAKQRPAETSREFQHLTRFTFAGRDWSASCRATAAYVSKARSWRPWGILAGGMILAGLLGAFLLAATGRTVIIERLGADRIRELEAAKATLEKEIAERRQSKD